MVEGGHQPRFAERDPVVADGTGAALAPRRYRERPKVVAASIFLAAVIWGWWAITPHGRGIPQPVWWCAVLAANVVLTRAGLETKRRIIRSLQRYLINPPIRVLLGI